MGPTGTGKTSFINLLSGSNLRIGRELESCTNDVQISQPFEVDGQMISLIDTPGFDDTNLSDTTVLNMIATYLSYSYDQGTHLAGVIYMHRILDNRIGGISARSFRMFRNLCGEASLRSVIITTTMWDKIEESVGEEREQELASKDIFFKPAIEKGARLARYANTVESAQAIIRSIIQQSTPSITLQIQEELSSGLDISETRAGKELAREIFEQMERHREEIRGLLAEIQEATRVRDEESRRELAQERSRLELVIHRLQLDSSNVVRGYRDALAKMEERLRLADSATAAAKLASPHAGAGTAPVGETNTRDNKPIRLSYKPSRRQRTAMPS
ncbi:P-loop containing nucleoside triphosphate hydrolase protein [Flammula alnicola]|nr:P-loop containing nucleoside triphosphate hydrolase protein [Flammula alnicola]